MVTTARYAEDCDRCNYDTHRCLGCGTGLAHGVGACDDCNAALAPVGRTEPAPEACVKCDHIHTPEGCTGPPSPSDIWAGVSPAVCDCG